MYFWLEKSEVDSANAYKHVLIFCWKTSYKLCDVIRSWRCLVCANNSLVRVGCMYVTWKL